MYGLHCCPHTSIAYMTKMREKKLRIRVHKTVGLRLITKEKNSERNVGAGGIS